MNQHPTCSTGKRSHSFLQFVRDTPRYQGLAQLIEDLPTQGLIYLTLQGQPQDVWEQLQQASDEWGSRS
jgi:hypothetical protein